ncbi:hypothetical protein RSOLAG22IIIB_05688 [Rhizoctonia solani]|uniref:Uncharacterized protein n=1 Tax=Rhizoctonia solani TaxID=456999 RepID=A0A0K6G8Q5_9AGAM|nr:hypothetical protein RSOLAG22IIIB_05688 [Rhizoctonia solani]
MEMDTMGEGVGVGVVALEQNDDLAMGAPPSAPGAIGTPRAGTTPLGTGQAERSAPESCRSAPVNPGPYSEEKVLFSLQLLVYLSKHPDVRQAFYEPLLPFPPLLMPVTSPSPRPCHYRLLLSLRMSFPSSSDSPSVRSLGNHSSPPSPRDSVLGGRDHAQCVPKRRPTKRDSTMREYAVGDVRISHASLSIVDGVERPNTVASSVRARQGPPILVQCARRRRLAGGRRSIECFHQLFCYSRRHRSRSPNATGDHEHGYTCTGEYR